MSGGMVTDRERHGCKTHCSGDDSILSHVEVGIAPWFGAHRIAIRRVLVAVTRIGGK